MDANAFLGGSHLKQHDVPTATLVTVTDTSSVDFEDPPETKMVLHFAELEKGLVMNKTNISVAIATFGSSDTSQWKGKQIILYADPSISFGGKVVGGLRLRPMSELEAQSAQGNVF